MIAAILLAATAAASPMGNDPVEPFRIVGNVHYVGASDVTSYLITTLRGHILLDGGYAETAPMIVANIRKLGFDPRDVRLILNSHAHLDHAGGIAELRRVTGAKFLASAPDAAQLARGGTDDPQFGNRFPFPPAPTRPTRPRRPAYLPRRHDADGAHHPRPHPRLHDLDDARRPPRRGLPLQRHRPIRLPPHRQLAVA